MHLLVRDRDRPRAPPTTLRGRGPMEIVRRRRRAPRHCFIINTQQLITGSDTDTDRRGVRARDSFSRSHLNRTIYYPRARRFFSLLSFIFFSLILFLSVFLLRRIRAPMYTTFNYYYYYPSINKISEFTSPPRCFFFFLLRYKKKKNSLKIPS